MNQSKSFKCNLGVYKKAKSQTDCLICKSDFLRSGWVKEVGRFLKESASSDLSYYLGNILSSDDIE